MNNSFKNDDDNSRKENSFGKKIGKTIFEVGKYTVGTSILILAAFGIEYLITGFRKNNNIPCTKKDILEEAKEKIQFFKDSVKSIQTESSESPIDINGKPFIWLDKIGHQGEAIAIVAKPKVGKTWAAINIAENPASGRVLYVMLDDVGGKQEIRFKKDTLLNKVDLITTSQWEDQLNALKENVVTGCTQKAKWDTLTPHMNSIESRREKLMRELGIKEVEMVDNILLLEIMMKDPKIKEYDTIILDSLNQLMENPSRIVLKYLKRLIHSCTRNNQTFVLLHHINKSGEITGGSAFSEIVDTVVIISTNGDGTDRLLVDATNSRFEQGFKWAIVEKKRIGKNSVGFSIIQEFDSDPASNARPNLENAIREILRNEDEMTFDDLTTRLQAARGDVNLTSIRNTLKDLEKVRYVRKGDGRTWKTIIVVVPSSSSK